MTKHMMYVQRQEKVLAAMCRVERALGDVFDSGKPLIFSASMVAHYTGLSNSTYLRNHLKDLALRGLLLAHPVTFNGKVLATTYTLTDHGRMLNEVLEDLYVRVRE